LEPVVVFAPHPLGTAATSRYPCGGREQESNLPGTAWQPQPGLKSGRPTGAASPPSPSIPRSFALRKRGRQLRDEFRFVCLFQTPAIEPEAAKRDAAEDWARQAAQK